MDVAWLFVGWISLGLGLMACDGAAIAHPAERLDPYERPCRVGGECPGRKCIRLLPNSAGMKGLCSRSCRSDEDCGTGASCFALGKAGPTCLARCAGPGGSGAGQDEKAAAREEGWDAATHATLEGVDRGQACAEGLRCVPVGAGGELACFVEPLPGGAKL